MPAASPTYVTPSLRDGNDGDDGKAGGDGETKASEVHGDACSGTGVRAAVDMLTKTREGGAAEIVGYLGVRVYVRALYVSSQRRTCRWMEIPLFFLTVSTVISEKGNDLNIR